MFKISYIVILLAGPIYVLAFDARIASVWSCMNKHPTDGYVDAVEVQTFFAEMKSNPSIPKRDNGTNRWEYKQSRPWHIKYPADPNGLNVDDFIRGWKVCAADTTTTLFFFFNHWDRNQNFFLDTADLVPWFQEIDSNNDNRWDYLSEFYPYMLDLYTRAPKSHFELLL